MYTFPFQILVIKSHTHLNIPSLVFFIVPFLLHPKYVGMFLKIYFYFPMGNKLVTMLSCNVRGLCDNLK